MLSHDTLEHFTFQNFEVIQHYKYNPIDENTMLPYQRYIFIAMLAKWIEEENLRREQE